ncbi:MAG: ArsR/SmtB family transcription factor [Breznakia sp.]
MDKLNKHEMLDPVDAEELSEFFKMYADPTRLKILDVLFKQEVSVGELADLLEMTHSSISHQLAVLRRSRIVKGRREHKNIFYSLDDKHIEVIFHFAFEHIKE